MKIAIDLDNTIFDYGSLLTMAAKLEGVDDDFASKDELKTIIKDNYSWPTTWIAIQGQLYGNLVRKIEISHELLEFLTSCKKNGQEVEIVSHKTRLSLCKRFNLQEVAKEVLSQTELKNIIDSKQINFFESLEEKLNYLNTESFDLIIDDLEKVLDSTKKTSSINVLFQETRNKTYITTKSWKTIEEITSVVSLISKERKIEDFSKISKQAYRCRTSKGTVFLKIFSDRLRAQREVQAMTSLYPTYILYKGEKTLLTKDLELAPIVKLTTNDTVPLANALLKVSKINSTFYATHGTFNIQCYRDNINKRIAKLDPSKQTLKKLAIISEYVLTRIPKDIEISLFNISPDFYKDNLGRRDGEICILDFESFGLDDPARVFLNFCHHPNHTYILSELNVVLEAFNMAFNDKNLKERIKVLFNYVSFDWILIMLNWQTPKNFSLVEEQLNNLYEKVLKGETIISSKKEVYEHLF